jgi:methylmalonyl-CoA mutase
VYLAILDPYPARAGFAADLFRAGGLQPSTGSVEAYPADGPAVTCLVGSDASYADQGMAAATALRAAGARQVWLAGTAQVAGVDGTLHRGCDALAVLQSALDASGVRA